jgi:tetratricopeptide (TPR) repeat protein
MIPSTDLFRLIKSLTKSEKRYFKLFATFSGDRKENNSLKLFDAIDDQDEYDEVVLKEKFKKETFAKQFAVAKNYLQHIIIKSLTAYHSDSSPIMQIYEILQSVEVLYDKGHFNICRKLIQRGKDLCVEYEKHLLLDRFLELESKIFMRHSDFSKVSEVIDSQVKALEEHKITLDHKRSVFAMYSRTAEIGVATTEEEVKSLNDLVASLNPKEPIDVAGKYYLYSFYNLYYCGTDNHIETLEYSEKIISLLESYPFFIEENPGAYLSALNNYCSSLLRFGEIEKTLRLIQKMRDIPNQKVFSNKRVEILPSLIFSYGIELYSYMASGKLKEALALETDILSMLTQYESDIHKNSIFEISFNMALAHFVEGNYDNTLSWLQKILNTYELQYREDLYLASRILALMAHYELKNVVLLYNLVSSTHRYLKNKKLLHGIESKLLQCLRSSAIADDETKNQKFIELKEAIEEANKNHNGGKILHSIDLLAWVNSKLLGKSMGTLSAQNYAENSKQEAKKYLKR